VIPSLFASGNRDRAWNISRAAALGAAVGFVAASFRTFGPLRDAGSTFSRIVEIGGVTLAFALLCAGAALLRNVIARWLISPKAK
jgi:hypothetical protein